MGFSFSLSLLHVTCSTPCIASATVCRFTTWTLLSKTIDFGRGRDFPSFFIYIKGLGWGDWGVGGVVKMVVGMVSSLKSLRSICYSHCETVLPVLLK